MEAAAERFNPLPPHQSSVALVARFMTRKPGRSPGFLFAGLMRRPARAWSRSCRRRCPFSFALHCFGQ
jgi:hypothetical protein